MNAEYYDLTHNKLCSSCMENEIKDDGTAAEDYQSIEGN